MKTATAVAMLAGSAAAANSKVDVTPVEKVITLIEEMQLKVVTEGKEEASTYDKFACFCKDTAKEKGDSITSLTTEQGDLKSKLTDEETNRDNADTDRNNAQDDINTTEGEIRTEKEKGEKRRAKYGVEITDMTGAVEALEGAIDVLKASDKSAEGTALVQMQDTVKTAVMMAQALGLKGANAPALMQLTNDGDHLMEVPVADYSFHSNDILDTLDTLLKEFRLEKDRVDQTEVKAQSDETKLLQEKADTLASHEVAFEAAKKAHAKAAAEVGRLSGDLTIVTSTLQDDQNYLIDLSDKCTKKSTLWDQRSEMRQGELLAITQALGILKSTVSDKTTEDTVRLNQEAMETSFVQVESKEVRKHNPLRMLAVKSKTMLNSSAFLASRSPREMVMALLKSRSTSLKSAILASVAAHAGKDPLAKVKKLIEELVLRLQKEAANENEHHGWCVKQTNLAEDKRDVNSQKTAELNDSLAKGESTRDKLIEDIAQLTKEIGSAEGQNSEDWSGLKGDLQKASDLRDQEKSDNKNTITDATEGQKAVEAATKVLSRFYAAAAKKGDNVYNSKKAGESSLIQQGPTADDLPDAGFDEEYGASQDDSTGVLGMLEVITSDFVRTIETTKALEKQQASDFLEFKTTTNTSLAEKNSSKTQYNTELTQTKNQISEDTTSFKDALNGLKNAVSELVDLHAACVDNGMSYEERVAAREKEVEALKEAAEILDNYRA